MKIKSILVSQPPPADIQKSPYNKLIDKYKISVDYFKFIKIDGIPSKEFRQARVNILDYSAVIFTSRQAVDHFFRIAKEVRANIPEDMKYFCISESTAYYLQNYVQYRKRKIFHGKQSFADLMEVIRKHKDNKFLFPCSEIHKQDIPNALEKEGIEFEKAVIYRTLACDLSKIDITSYDMLVFFSPSGIKSLFKNFPDFEQGEQAIATFGKTTAEAAKSAGLKIQVNAPTPKAPSMSMSIEQYVKDSNKRKR
ncbi:MAG: uroporphyrinogen-III synthase [Bacteroidetes bacterium]|nr:MAG: uroporphyrinogen-III synthase [Bacteroidota bacterium]